MSADDFNLFPSDEPQAPTENAELIVVASERLGTEHIKTAADEDRILQELLGFIAPVNEDEPWLKLCIYAEFGVGKTTFAAKAPKPLLVDADRGTKSLINDPLLASIPKMKFKGFGQLVLLAEKMEQYPEVFAQYETIIIDTFSEVQDRNLKTITTNAAANDVTRNRYKADTPDYIENTAKIKELLDAYKRIDKHVILLCHEGRAEDELKRQFLKPNIPTKLLEAVGKMCDLVGYMTAQGEGVDRKRYLQTQPTLGILAKTRIGGLPHVIEEPSFDTILTQHLTNIANSKLSQNKAK